MEVFAKSSSAVDRAEAKLQFQNACETSWFRKAFGAAIRVETQSRTTHENALYFKAMIDTTHDGRSY